MQRFATCALWWALLCPFALASTDSTKQVAQEPDWTCGSELTGANPARILAREVMKRAQHVVVDPDRAVHVAKILADANYGAFRIPTWDYPPYPDRTMSRMEAIRFLLVCDSINYRYVTDDGLAEYSSSDGWKGAGLMVKRVAENWETLGDPMALARLSTADVERIFAADVPMPVLEERRKHLNEVGAYLLANPDAGHATWLEKHKTPMALAIHLARSIPGYKEPFLKRAQLFVGMVIGRFRSDDDFPAAFKEAGELSVYADYVLPSILHRMGIVRFAPDLEQKIRRGVALAANSREEVEIRAATLVAADELKKALLATNRFPDISLLGLDFALWIQAKEIDIPETEMPAAVFVNPPLRYHRATTTAY